MFETIFTICLFLGIFSILNKVRSQKSLLLKFENNWLEGPTVADPRCQEIAGEWEGVQSNAEAMNLPVENEDALFIKARLTVFEGSITGVIIDRFGICDVDGVINYPKVKLVSRIRSVAKSGFEGTKEQATRYYQGELSHRGVTLSGTWFHDPLNKWKCAGDFRLTNKEKDNLLTMEEKLSSGSPTESDQRETPEVAVPADETLNKDLLNSPQEAPHEDLLQEDLLKKYQEALVEVPGSADSAGQSTFDQDLPEVVSVPGSISPLAELESLAKKKREEEEKLPEVNLDGPALTGGIKGSVICPHCQAETSGSFDFCLYCSESINKADA